MWLAIARRFMAEGSSVVITDIHARAGESAAAREGFTFFEHNVTREDQWVRIVEQIETPLFLRNDGVAAHLSEDHGSGN